MTDGQQAEMEYEIIDGETGDRVLSVGRNTTYGTGVIFVHPPDGEGAVYEVTLMVPPPPKYAAADLAAAAKSEAGGWSYGAVNAVIRKVEQTTPGVTVSKHHGEVPEADGPIV